MRLRVLINATGSHGDVLPFIALAQEFQRRGHDARLYATAVFEPFARDVGVPFKALGSVEDYESLLQDPDINHPMRQLRVVARGMDDFGHAAFQAMDADVRPEDTVIVGSTLAFVTRSLAEIHKIPTVTVHLAPSIVRTIHRLPRHSTWSPWHGAPRLLKRLQWLLVDRLLIDPTIGAALNRHRIPLGLPPVRRAFRDWINQANVVVGMFPEWFAQPQPDWPSNLRLTGFPLYDHAQSQPLSADVEAFLASGEPPVAFTAGTANAGAHEFFAASAEACRRTGKRGILLARHARFDVEDPVAKSRAGPGVTVMGFIGMKDEHLAGHAVLRCASVSKGLDALERGADGVSVMPVRIEGTPRKESFEPLESRA